MSKIKRIAIIGTREPSKEMYDLNFNYAYELSKLGIEISTGGAKGIDTAAMEGASKWLGANLHVFLHDTARIDKMPFSANIIVYDKKIHKDWTQSVYKFHPSKGNLSPNIFALHARNYGIIMDPKPVDAVIATPKSLMDWGGTGQGMRIALGSFIPLFNLTFKDSRQKLDEWIHFNTF